jgi:predicted RNA-binding Zn-ribbon protein involved in translation (DUF1610 family)
MGWESKCQFITLVGGAVQSSLLARRSRPFEVSKMQFNVGSQKKLQSSQRRTASMACPNCGGETLPRKAMK